MKNAGSGAAEDITYVVETSPDNANWAQDMGSIISLPAGESKVSTGTH